MAVDHAPKRRRWVLWFGAFVLVALVGVAAGLPWLASTAPGTRWVVAAVNRALAPARIEVKSVRLSWRGPLELRKLMVRDAAGKALVAARRATFDRGLWSVITGRLGRCRLALEGAALDVTRSADGSIDLANALASALPRTSQPAGPASNGGTRSIELTVAIDGSLRFSTPELIDPVKATRFSATIETPASGGPATWQVAMAEPTTGDRATLAITGRFDHRAPFGAAASLSATVQGERWPFAVLVGENGVRGRLAGRFEAKRQDGFWTIAGDPNVLDLDLSGPSLRGDRLRLDRVALGCDVAQTHAAWDIRRLVLNSSVVTLNVAETLASSGGGTQAASVRVDGQLDVAKLARHLPRALRLREGLIIDGGVARTELIVSKEVGTEGRRVVFDARLSNVIGRDSRGSLKVPEAAKLSVRMLQHDDNVLIEEAVLSADGFQARASGDVKRGVALSGSYDLHVLQASYGRLFDLGGIELGGRGVLAGDYRRVDSKTFIGRLASELVPLEIKGLASNVVRRPKLRVDAAVSGSANDSGLPVDWVRSRMGITSHELSAEMKLASESVGQSIRIDEVRVEWQPAKAAGSTAPHSTPTDAFRFVARGRFDPAEGTLDLHAYPDALSDPVLLTREGLRFSGIGKPGSIHGVGSLTADLARFDRFMASALGTSPIGLGGGASFKSELTIDPAGRVTLLGAGESSDASVPGSRPGYRRPVAPLTIQLGARQLSGADRIDIESLRLVCLYGTIQSKGHVSDPTGRRVLDVGGTIIPDWNAVDRLLARQLEPGARIRGRSPVFKLQGSLAQPSLVELGQALHAEFRADNVEGVAYGLRASPTSLVARSQNGRIAVEPIQTTINGGKATLRPEVTLAAKDGPTISLAQGSSIEGLLLDDQLARRLLGYVAPVVEENAHVTGRASIRVDRAEFPLGASRGRSSVSIAGRVEFDDVACSPGALAAELFAMTGQRPRTVHLKETVEVTVADGRVSHRGLAVPVGKNAKIELDGSVGFDQSLALRARLFADRGMFGQNQRELDTILEALQVGVPIGGTLRRPSIDRGSARVGLRDLGKALLKRSGNREAAELLEQLVRPESETTTKRR